MPERRVCRLLRVARGVTQQMCALTLEARAEEAELLARVKHWIEAQATFGYRRAWALLRVRDGRVVNRKRIYWVLRRQRRSLHQRWVTPRPRFHGRRSIAAASNERGARDVTHVPVGPDGWAHLAAVIDCHGRAVAGCGFGFRRRAHEAGRTPEDACLARFGALRPRGRTPVVRSDNGLTFRSRRFRPACWAYLLRREFITPDAPEENGVIERFFRSLQEEAAWQYSVANSREARRTIARWIDCHNAEPTQ